MHSLAQTWSQIGRNPAAALGNIAPNIGSVVAIEKSASGQLFPPFLALNSPGGVGNGYFSATYAPFRVVPSTAGVPNTSSPLGQTRFNDLWSHVHELDGSLRTNSPYGQPLQAYDAFYNSAKSLTYNSVVNQAFAYRATDMLSDLKSSGLLDETLVVMAGEFGRPCDSRGRSRSLAAANGSVRRRRRPWRTRHRIHNSRRLR